MALYLLETIGSLHKIISLASFFPESLPLTGDSRLGSSLTTPKVHLWGILGGVPL